MITENSVSSVSEAKPFVKWAGGKRQILHILIKNLPTEIYQGKIKVYAEPFVGGGALFFKLKSMFDFEKVILADKNKDLINAYTSVRDDVASLIKILKELEKRFYESKDRKEFYYAMREKFNNKRKFDIERAALFLFLNKTCFNGLYRVNSKGKFNVPFGRYKNPVICEEKNLMNASRLLSDTELIAGDFTLIEKEIGANTFVYLDPPYRPISETSSFTSYNSDSFDDKEQERLAKFVRKIDRKNVKFMLSNSYSKDGFFQKLYSGFDIKTIIVKRYISATIAGRTEVREILVKNY
ncbi:MAG: DNA adenine methylase [Caldisericaceae bacterium]|nr:DNA adenine methylase [Caldisericaceae bacterium]